MVSNYVLVIGWIVVVNRHAWIRDIYKTIVQCVLCLYFLPSVCVCTCTCVCVCTCTCVCVCTCTCVCVCTCTCVCVCVCVGCVYLGYTSLCIHICYIPLGHALFCRFQLYSTCTTWLKWVWPCPPLATTTSSLTTIAVPFQSSLLVDSRCPCPLMIHCSSISPR